MKTCIIDNKHEPHKVPTIFLEPENDRDREQLQQLLENYVVVGCGFDEHEDIRHLELQLNAPEKITQ